MYKARLEAMGRIVRTRVARLRVTKMYLSEKVCHSFSSSFISIILVIIIKITFADLSAGTTGWPENQDIIYWCC